MGLKIMCAEPIEMGDQRRTKGSDGGHGYDAVAPPGIYGAKQTMVTGGGVPDSGEKFGDAIPLGFWIRGLGRFAG